MTNRQTPSDDELATLILGPVADKFGPIVGMAPLARAVMLAGFRMMSDVEGPATTATYLQVMADQAREMAAPKRAND